MKVRFLYSPLLIYGLFEKGRAKRVEQPYPNYEAPSNRFSFFMLNHHVIQYAVRC